MQNGFMSPNVEQNAFVSSSAMASAFQAPVSTMQGISFGVSSSNPQMQKLVEGPVFSTGSDPLTVFGETDLESSTSATNFRSMSFDDMNLSGISNGFIPQHLPMDMAAFQDGQMALTNINQIQGVDVPHNTVLELCV